jgi:DNA-directed RNA polymerase specialized sigma24 family protein
MFSQNEVSATLGYALSHVRQVLRRQFPTMDYNCIDDAVATAVELFIRKAPAHLRQSRAGAFCWIRTTATNELRRMAHAARRFIRPSDAVSLFDVISSDEPVDYKAHARVLFDWLVTILGVAAAETVWLHDVERWTPRDIASAKQINIAAVKARISRSRRILRHVMASSR